MIRTLTIRVDGPRLDELMRLAEQAGTPFPGIEPAAELALSLGLCDMLGTYRPARRDRHSGGRAAMTLQSGPALDPNLCAMFARIQRRERRMRYMARLFAALVWIAVLLVYTAVAT